MQSELKRKSLKGGAQFCSVYKIVHQKVLAQKWQLVNAYAYEQNIIGVVCLD